MSLGIVQYLLKPFVFSSLRDKLERYAAYRERLLADTSVAGQHEVDRMLAQLRGGAGAGLPKGMSAESLDAVTDVMRASSTPLSASEVATKTGTSRLTARRYLEYLAECGIAEQRNRYGSTGRPELEYLWRG